MTTRELIERARERIADVVTHDGRRDLLAAIDAHLSEPQPVVFANVLTPPDVTVTQQSSDACEAAYEQYRKNLNGAPTFPAEAFRSGWFWREAMTAPPVAQPDNRKALADEAKRMAASYADDRAYFRGDRGPAAFFKMREACFAAIDKLAAAQPVQEPAGDAVVPASSRATPWPQADGWRIDEFGDIEPYAEPYWRVWQAARAQPPAPPVPVQPTKLSIQSLWPLMPSGEIDPRSELAKASGHDISPQAIATACENSWNWLMHGKKTGPCVSAPQLREAARLLSARSVPEVPAAPWPPQYGEFAADLEPLEKAIDEYIDGYVMCGDDGDYTPLDRERFLIKDAVMGLLVDPDFERELIAKRPEVEVHPAVPDAGVACEHSSGQDTLRTAVEMLESYAECITAGGCKEGGKDFYASFHYIPSIQEVVETLRNQAVPAESEWVSVQDRMPKSGVTVLACYQNRAGKLRRICAQWIAAKSIESSHDSDIGVYDEDADTFYDPEGWYERIDNWDDYTAVAVCEGDVTHWMPLPAPPQPGQQGRVQAADAAGSDVNKCAVSGMLVTDIDACSDCDPCLFGQPKAGSAAGSDEFEAAVEIETVAWLDVSANTAGMTPTERVLRAVKAVVEEARETRSLRRAALKVIKTRDDFGWCREVDDAIDALRVALSKNSAARKGGEA